jgi:hypothetical protein
MSDEVLDFAAFLKRKKITDCDHPTAEVDTNVASLTCGVCGHELDPWWWLRKLANEPELFERQFVEQQARIVKQNQEIIDICTAANVTIARLNAEIAELYAVKNRLANEQVDGMSLGSHAARMRRRKKA